MFPGSDSQKVIGISHASSVLWNRGMPCNTPGWIRNHL